MGESNVREILTELESNTATAKKIVTVLEAPESPPKYGKIVLNPSLIPVLESRNIKKLYHHQVDAIKKIRDGNHVLVSTPTASGKTLIYNIPVIESLLENPGNTALYIFPNKALANNQLLELNYLLNELPPHGILPRRFDGDDDKKMKQTIRTILQPNILLTNPDMLHYMLSNHRSWEYFFDNLKFVIIDEVHIYRGVFGSHVANILRRLNLVCESHKTTPLFICSSATIANQQEFISSLTGKDQFKIISNSGSPVSKKHFMFWNPYYELSEEYVDQAEVQNDKSLSGSKLKDANDLFLRATNKGFQTICFTNSRIEAEIMKIHCDSSIAGAKELRELSGKISAYRSGYLKEERTDIENKLVSNELEGVISTNALELGINIGHLDVCVLAGYPGTMCSTWQRAGRVGRKDKEALVAMIASNEALNQFLINHPEMFHIENPSETVESAIIDPYNEKIARQHLLCAAKEVPLKKDFMHTFGLESIGIVEQLLNDGKLRKSKYGNFYCTEYHHESVHIRSIGENFKLLHLTEEVGKISSPQVYRECHQGAIYLHNGRQFKVRELNVEKLTVLMEENSQRKYLTKPILNKEVDYGKPENNKKSNNFELHFGPLTVTETVDGFARVERFNPYTVIREIIFDEDHQLPPIIMNTKGVWLKFDLEKFDAHPDDVLDGLHGIEHNLVSLLPLYVMCDSRDMGGFSTIHKNKAIMTIYDGYEGGIGYTRKAFDKYQDLLKHSLESISGCKCKNGCPQCIMSSSCGNANTNLNKKMSIRILKWFTK